LLLFLIERPDNTASRPRRAAAARGNKDAAHKKLSNTHTSTHIHISGRSTPPPRAAALYRGKIFTSASVQTQRVRSHLLRYGNGKQRAKGGRFKTTLSHHSREHIK
jgi:hypothetical protein